MNCNRLYDNATEPDLPEPKEVAASSHRGARALEDVEEAAEAMVVR